MSRLKLSLGIKRFLLKTVLDRKKIYKDFVLNSGGTITAQGINVGFIYITSQLYDAQAFGAYAVWLSFITLFVLFFNLKLELAFVTAETEEDSKEIIKTIFSLSLISTLLLLLFYFSGRALALINITYPIFFLLLFCVLFLNLKTLGDYLLTRLGDFKVFSLLLVFNAMLLGTAQIVFFYLTSGKSSGLLLGYLVSLLITGGIYFRLMKQKKLLPSFVSIFDFRSAVTKLKEKRDTTIWRSSDSVVEVLYTNGIYLVLNSFVSQGQLGQFNLAHRISSLPIGLFSSAANVFFHHGAKDDLSSIQGFIYKFAIGIITISALATAILLYYGEILISFFFGEQWSATGNILGFVVIGQSILYLSSSFTRFPDILGIQKKMFYVQFGCSVFMITGLLLLAYWEINFISIVLFYSLTIAIYNGLWLLILFANSELSASRMFLILLLYPVLVSIFCTVFSVLVNSEFYCS